MTVAAFIGAGETSVLGLEKTPGLGMTQDTAHGSGRTGAAASGLMSSTVPAAASFRSGWQSLLASLSSGMAVSGEDQGTASAGPAAGEISEKSTFSTQAAGIRLRQGQGTEKESVETSAETMLSSAGARTQTLVAELAAKAAKPASTSAEENKPSAEPGTESTRSSHSARSSNIIKTDSVSAEPLPGLVPAAIASLSQTVPATAIASPVAQNRDETAQLAQTEIYAALSTDQQAVVASAADKDAPPAVAMLAAGGNATETPAPGRRLTLFTEAAARNASPAETPATSQTPSQTSSSVPGQNPSQAAETNLNSSEMPAASQVPPPIFVSGQNQTHSLAPDRQPIRIAAPGMNPIPAEVASHNLTSATAPTTNPAETEKTSTSSTSVLVPDLSRSSTFISSQEQIAIQQGNQGVSGFAGDSLNPLAFTAGAADQSGLLSAQSSALNKPGSAAGGKESIRGNGNSVQQVSHLTAGQTTVPAADASAMARALAGTGGTVNTSNEPAGASSMAATRPDSREAFATLDGADTPGSTTWIHAGTQHAEAGYQDPALGWVGVRADLSGGGVHAQLVPGSADAAQALGSHLAGLNAYLAEHHTPVETLSLTSPEGGWPGPGSGQGTGEGTQQGAGQQTAQGADAGTLSGQSADSVIQSPAASAELPTFFGDMDGITSPASLDGYHISVMA